ncbi:MAG TPA: hypothetical protein VMU14_17850, partial [Acidimicrobiales bacterium]|nr:hypothetical protein [Acidimicrobiales bacterium]
GLASVLVPFASTWHPLAIAWGVVSLYLLAAVELTSLVRRHLPRTLWRRVHALSFPLFVSATVHGLSAGTDAGVPMVMICAALGCAAVAVLVALRLSHRGGAGSPPVRREPRVPLRTPWPVERDVPRARVPAGAR